ncbi:hypothetical protein Tco_0644477 [Tanacetum coccineum]
MNNGYQPSIDIESMAEINSNVTFDSLDMSHNVRKVDQHAAKHDNERMLLASLIAKFKLDIESNKEINKDLKKVNTSLSQELWFCKNELKKYKVFQINHKKKRKLNLNVKKLLVYW